MHKVFSFVHVEDRIFAGAILPNGAAQLPEKFYFSGIRVFYWRIRDKIAVMKS
jgi:hypothetical protein